MRATACRDLITLNLMKNATQMVGLRGANHVTNGPLNSAREFVYYITLT